MAGSSQEKSPQESSLLEQMNSLAPHGTSRSFRHQFEGLRDRIRKGETTGSQISDYLRLRYYDREEIDKKQEKLEEFQIKVGKHVGEDVLVIAEYSRRGIHRFTSHEYGIISGSELQMRFEHHSWNRAKLNRMWGDPEDKDADKGPTLEWNSRHPDLVIPTGGVHIYRHGGGKFLFDGKKGYRSEPTTELKQEDIAFVEDVYGVIIGKEEVGKWRQEAGNEEVYQELSQALKESSPSLA